MPALDVRHRQPIAALFYSLLGALLVGILVLSLGIFISTSSVFASSDAAGLAALVLMVSTIASLIAVSYPVLYFLLFTYEIREHAITINSGIIFRQHESINYGRIQAVDNERGPLLMLFGLTLVEIWTSSPDQIVRAPHGVHSRPDATLLLRKADAEALKDFIAHRPPSAAL